MSTEINDDVSIITITSKDSKNVQTFRLWIDRSREQVYKIEVKGEHFTGYLNPDEFLDRLVINLKPKI